MTECKHEIAVAGSGRQVGVERRSPPVKGSVELGYDEVPPLNWRVLTVSGSASTKQRKKAAGKNTTKGALP